MKLYTTQNYYLMELREIWAHNFFEECARLCESSPHLNDKAREQLAANIVTKAMYYDQKDKLPKYWRTTSWRIDRR